LGRGELTVEYHGFRILTASVTAKDADGKRVAVNFESKADAADEKVEQTLTFTLAEQLYTYAERSPRGCPW